ncbi:unnamed protein product [Gordionus sp. m RMFG-2023]|uniref:damage-control phosphatase ARMT1-like n=1 Tax=Gordionus sp. m RMFG-2023 TaxID=3053472 RepID=UPI0030E0E14F
MTYPQPLSAKHRNSFAYVTVRDRLPTILGRVIDFVYRSWDGFRKKYGKEAEEDINLINAALSRLHYQIQTNKPLEPITDNKDDKILWNSEFDKLFKKDGNLLWFESPWLFIETFMYRKINESFFNSKFLQDFDPFSEIKHQSFENSIDAILIICEYLYKLNNLGWEDSDAMEAIFHKIMKVSLWGNKFDLSLSNMNATQVVENPLVNLDSFDPFIMRNDLQFVLNHLKRLKERSLGATNNLHQKGLYIRTIDLILDNSGFELFTDLVLAYYLLKSNYTDRIILRGKIMPWYVSDTTAKDFIDLLTWLSNPEDDCENHQKYNDLYVREDVKNKTEAGEDPKNISVIDKDMKEEMKFYGKWFAREIKQLMENRDCKTLHDRDLSRIEYKDNYYWTLPSDYDAMSDLDPKLYQELSHSDLLIFKGDLNFRKLVGDLQWIPHTSFREALRRFTPAPLLTMRTNKSDLIVGISPQIEEIAEKTYPQNWMISGEYAIIEFDR